MNKRTKSLRRAFSLVLLFVTALAVIRSSQAIIIRHDKNYADYEVNESRFPAVFYLERQARRKVCVATLVHPQWAITAAHCATETRLSVSLDDGINFPVTIAGKEQLIDMLVVHPDYLPDSPDEVDLALLRFANPLELPLPVMLNSKLDEDGQTVSLLGWGFFGIGTTGRQYDDGRLRMAQNRIEQAGRRLRVRFDDPREPGSTALDLEGMPGLGDSGGPALQAAESGWVIAGVAVGEVVDADFSEEKQGSYGSVAIYERVSIHLDWIRHTIGENNLHTSE